MKTAFVLILTLVASLAHAQMTAKEAQEEAWAKAVKAKAADEKAVAAQKAADKKKNVPPATKTEIHIYDGNGGKGYNVKK